MFEIDENTKQISISRGQSATLTVDTTINGEAYTFQPGDIVRFAVFKKDNYKSLLFLKDIEIGEATENVDIPLLSSDTEEFAIVNKPTDFYYEIELNPDTPGSQMIICHDKDGAKIFTLYPTGGTK